MAGVRASSNEQLISAGSHRGGPRASVERRIGLARDLPWPKTVNKPLRAVMMAREDGMTSEATGEMSGVAVAGIRPSCCEVSMRRDAQAASQRVVISAPAPSFPPAGQHNEHVLRTVFNSIQRSRSRSRSRRQSPDRLVSRARCMFAVAICARRGPGPGLPFNTSEETQASDIGTDSGLTVDRYMKAVSLPLCSWLRACNSGTFHHQRVQRSRRPRASL
jgi:hypothetical protein